MGKGKPVRKPIASAGALFIALLLSGQTVAFAYKGGHGPANPAIPNVNLGLAAMPKTGAGVGLPAASAAALKAGPVSIPAGGSKSYLGVGNGVTAQSAAPGASRSASSAGLMPPGLNKNTGQGQGAQNSVSNAGAFPPGQNGNSGKGAENSTSGAGAFPPGQQSSGASGPGSSGNSGDGPSGSSGRGSSGSSGSGSSGSSGQGGGQGQGNGQDSGNLPQTEIVAQARSNESSQTQPNETSQDKRPDQLPTCR